MNRQQTCFTTFSSSIKEYTLPENFTFPFCYEPHPLCLLASKELQHKLENDRSNQQALAEIGKMFGVLIVENQKKEIGYLTAFSGKLESENLKNSNFVPSVFQLDDKSNWYNDSSIIVNQLNKEVEELSSNPQLKKLQCKIESSLKQQTEALAKQHVQMALNRKNRKLKRATIKEKSTENVAAEQLKNLAKESIKDKKDLKNLKEYWHNIITASQQRLFELTDEIDEIKKTRKRLSTRLQKKLFKQYRLLNKAGNEKDLIELFQKTPNSIPPAGTGDCAAPKLLQYAFKHKMKPLAMAEFWWGKAPKSKIRQHKNFYAACSGKCQPILEHMLEGIVLDENPLLINPAQGKTLKIIYQDNDIVVVNKPNEFLSVPGKYIEDSVYLRIKQKFPEATGSLIVHRLDMSTSGIMVLALTKHAQKKLQQQFINRTIKKRYVALLETKLETQLVNNIHNQLQNDKGKINLPLRGDFEDRPRQLVCYQHGKKALTQWEIIDTDNGKTKLYLYPETGRTHQLRVHCAHPDGLNIPILGDDLYGRLQKSEVQRLYLHAQKLSLVHPVTNEEMVFKVDEDF